MAAQDVTILGHGPIRRQHQVFHHDQDVSGSDASFISRRSRLHRRNPDAGYTAIFGGNRLPVDSDRIDIVTRFQLVDHRKGLIARDAERLAGAGIA